MKPTSEKQKCKENCRKREHAETAVPNVPQDHRYPARMLIEFCCSENSAMGNNNKESHGCRVVRVHEQLDAKTDSCRNKIMMEVEAFRVEHPNAPILVHAALPCTGGSSWQFVNQAVGNCETIKKKRQQFRTLLKALKRLLKSLSSDGGCVFLTFELPRTCLYWKWSEVQSLVQQHQLCKFRIDGCAVGVKDAKGLPLLKSWTLASNVVCMNEIEEHICDGTHTWKRERVFTQTRRKLHKEIRFDCTSCMETRVRCTMQVRYSVSQAIPNACQTQQCHVLCGVVV